MKKESKAISQLIEIIKQTNQASKQDKHSTLIVFKLHLFALLAIY